MSTYVVVEFNQASRQAEAIHGPCWNEQEAQEQLDVLQRYTASTGRRETYRVGVIEYPEDDDA